MMIGMCNHLLSNFFRFHYHSQKVIRSLGKKDVVKICRIIQPPFSVKRRYMIYDMYIAMCHKVGVPTKTQTQQTCAVGGFNPSEKYIRVRLRLKSFPHRFRVKHIKSLKPPPTFGPQNPQIDKGLKPIG